MKSYKAEQEEKQRQAEIMQRLAQAVTMKMKKRGLHNRESLQEKQEKVAKESGTQMTMK